MHDAFFDFFVPKSFLTKNYFLTAEINLTTLGPLYTCLVVIWILSSKLIHEIMEFYASACIILQGEGHFRMKPLVDTKSSVEL